MNIFFAGVTRKHGRSTPIVLSMAGLLVASLGVSLTGCSPSKETAAPAVPAAYVETSPTGSPDADPEWADDPEAEAGASASPTSPSPESSPEPSPSSISKPTASASTTRRAIAQPTTRRTTTTRTTTRTPTTRKTSVYYKNCTEARRAGAAPIFKGQPGYRSALDRDRDGIACE